MAKEDLKNEVLRTAHPYDETSGHKREVNPTTNAESMKFSIRDFFMSLENKGCDDEASVRDLVFHDSISSEEEDSSQATGFTHEHVTGPNITCCDPVPTRISSREAKKEDGREAPCNPVGVTICGPKLMTQCGAKQILAKKDGDALDFVFEIVESAMCGEGTTTLMPPSKGRKNKQGTTRPTELSEKSIYLLRNNSIMEKSVTSEGSHIGSLRLKWSDEQEKPSKRSILRTNKYRETRSVSSQSNKTSNTNVSQKRTLVLSAAVAARVEKEIDEARKEMLANKADEQKGEEVEGRDDTSTQSKEEESLVISVSSQSNKTSNTEASQKRTLVLSAAVAARVEKEIDEARKKMLANKADEQKGEEVEGRDDTSTQSKEEESLVMLAKVDVGPSIPTILQTGNDCKRNNDVSKCSNTVATSAASLSDAEAPDGARELVAFSDSSISSMDDDDMFPAQVNEGTRTAARMEKTQELWTEIVEFSYRLYKELSGETKGQQHVPAAKGLYFLACLVFFLFWPSNLKKEEKRGEYAAVAGRQHVKKTSLLDLVQES
jgi:hypothetical protein